MTTDERTPLIPKEDTGRKSFTSWLRTAVSVENRILFAGFLITLAFSYTQVPYVHDRLRETPQLI